MRRGPRVTSTWAVGPLLVTPGLDLQPRIPFRRWIQVDPPSGGCDGLDHCGRPPRTGPVRLSLDVKEMPSQGLLGVHLVRFKVAPGIPGNLAASATG